MTAAPAFDGAAFDAEARALLLGVKGVGPTVIARFEQLGIATLADLAALEEEDIRARTALLLGGSCWRNSPQAKASVAAAIAAARAFSSHDGSENADKA